MINARQTSSFLRQITSERGHQASEDRFVTFMEHLRGIAFIKDPHGRYVYLNAACATLLGISIPDALYKTDQELWPRHLAAIYKLNDRGVLRQGKTFEGIEPFLQAGETRYWLMYKFPIVEEETRRLYLGAIGVDIAGREHFEQRVLQSRKFELIGQMAGGVAHHFNNLLTVIAGYSHMAMDELGPAHKSRLHLQEVLDAADSAAALTSELLSFSRRQMLQLRDMDLNRLVSRTARTLRPAIGDAIQLCLDLCPGLARVRADPKYVRRVVEALAINAVDAMRCGGRLTIATCNVPSGSVPRVRLTVRDTGNGMSEETRMRLFEPFFTTKEVGKGAGLGLSSVYGIVKQHGGEIAVESRLGAGTTFDVFLPALPPGSPAAEAIIAAPDTSQRTGTDTHGTSAAA